MTVAPKTKRFMLWGGIGAGKTTLLRALQQESAAPARKTQMIDYAGWGIDTPGEYSEMGHLRRHLVTTATDAQLILVVHDATRRDSYFPPHYFLMFSQPIIGVVNKIDAPNADPDRATALLRQSGVTGEIFYISAINGSGLSSLRQSLLTYSSNRKE
ncbi:MAG: ethanolamine utilization protein EutP [Anaerolineales bacterium]|nr:ethanolamine utilization protein EutP [Anaerolineales bacterium]